MAKDEKLHQCGVDASEALRAAADILMDSSIAFDRRLQAYRRCIAQHARLLAKFTQAAEKHIQAATYSASERRV
jgi:hypothetical protein